MARLETPATFREHSVRYDRRPGLVHIATPTAAVPKQFRKGGKVKKSGLALVHKGERVLTKREARKR